MPPHLEKHPPPGPALPESISSKFAHAFQASQLFRSCALASSKVATRPERVIGPLTVIDQNQRSLSGPPTTLVDAADLPLASMV